MVRIRQMRMISYVATLLMITMYIAPATSFAKRGTSNTLVQKKTVVVFPFENAAKSSIETLSADLLESMQSAISSNGGFSAIAYSERLPSVQRSVRELTLKPDDVKGPFGTDQEQIASALKVSREIATDLLLIGSIDDIQVDTAANKAEVTLTAIMVDVRTGETLKSIAINGQTPANKSTVESDLIMMAAGDAVAKLAKEIVPANEATVAPTATKDTPVVVQKRSKKKTSTIRRLLIPLVIGVAIALVASSNDDNTSDDIDNPPVGPF